MMLVLAVILSMATSAIAFFSGGALSVIIPYAFIHPVLFCLPRAAWRLSPALRSRVTARWAPSLEFLFLFVIVLNAPGSLFLHAMGVQYDRFLHVSAAYVSTIIAAILLAPARAKKTTTLLIVFGLLVAGLFLWEGLQYASDRVFGTQLFHDAVQNIQQDALEDIFFGCIGVALGLLTLAYRYDALVASKQKALQTPQGQENQ